MPVSSPSVRESRFIKEVLPGITEVRPPATYYSTTSGAGGGFNPLLRRPTSCDM